MFKLPEIPTSRIKPPLAIPLLGVLLVLTLFIGYQIFNEYRIYQINQITQDFPTASGTASEVVISWRDDSTNESGFIVERKSDGDYALIATLNPNETSYIDYAGVAGKQSCYRVASFNEAGSAYSGESCIDLPEVVPPLPSDEEPETGNDVWYTFIDKPGVVELDGREFYSIKSGAYFNSSFSADEIIDVNFAIASGKLAYRDSNRFVFKDQGRVLENGFVKMKFNELNSFSFSLQGSGNYQEATLLLSAIARDMEGAMFTVSVGDITETITLPEIAKLYYLSIEIGFDQLASVKITPIGKHKRSFINLAGIILNEPSQIQSDVGGSRP
ncbi:hypothetical protein [Psychromonas sp. MME2]|uniref:hypothetical protein n=1 Tax=Psychromonas sp. MME2 TaxID=3231033 RepID=UPI00339CB7BD